MEYKNTINTTTYDAGDGFLVDIVTTPTKLESWLYHKDYGVKTLMFGMMCDDINYDEYRDCVEAALSEYKVTYREEVMEMTFDQDMTEWLEENDDGEYDLMVEDTIYYILNKLGEDGDPEPIYEQIRKYAVELVKDTLYPLAVSRLIAAQAIARYKDGLYDVNWKETT